MSESAEPGTNGTKLYLWLLWIFAGAAYGVFLRFLFGVLPPSVTNSGVMSAAFLLGAPLAAGALAVYAAPDDKKSLKFAIFAPWAAIVLMLIGCAVTLMEGSICIALLSPLFLICGSVGGLGMYVGQRITKRRGTSATAFALLPLVLLFGESFVPIANQDLSISQSIIIDANPERVWREIVDARDIRADELPPSLSHIIGVPRPIEGVNRVTPYGEIRTSIWERGVEFRGIVRERLEYKTIRWEYEFDSHSFPPGSMDDHVAIGGRFFDLKDTRFELDEIEANQTELVLVAKYRVSSAINLYAVPAAKILGHDFVRTILGLYKRRSESAEKRTDIAAKYIPELTAADCM